MLSIMKQYVIDELRYADYEKLKDYLETHFGGSAMNQLYWIPVDEALLDAVQKAHTECHPLCFAIELEERRMAMELLVRTRNRMRCDCIRYANTEQRNWLIDSLDAIFEKLEIKT